MSGLTGLLARDEAERTAEAIAALIDGLYIRRALKDALLDEGYNRLIGFECKTTRGFEWFGADPGHEALSAYGLLEFTDMAQVRNVDPRLLADTRAFVMKCRDGNGGFKRERNTLPDHA